jgi:hypothetical protein
MENSGLIHMMKNNKYEEIGLTYEMFLKVPDALSLLKYHLSNFIVIEGNKLV